MTKVFSRSGYVALARYVPLTHHLKIDFTGKTWLSISIPYWGQNTVLRNWAKYSMAKLQPDDTTNYYHYTSAFLVAAVGLPFVSLALWSRWARASCAGPWRVRGAWGRGPGAVGGGRRFCWQLPPTLPPPQLPTLSGPSPALCLAGPPSLVVPPLLWLRARGVRLPWSAGLVGRLAGRRWLLGIHSNYILHYIPLVLCYFELLITLCLSHLGR